MSALAIQEPRAGVVAGAAPKALIPTDLDGLWRLAKMISSSGLAPKDMSRPDTVATAIMAGMEIGLTPMQAIQSIAIVNGRPSVYGDAALALVINHTSCEDVIERVEGVGEAMAATCTVKRKGRTPVVRTFSVADAKTAGLLDKAGPWRQYRARMLQLRARAFALRDAFPDVLKGIGIREEQEDIVPIKDVTPPKSAEMPPMPAAIASPGPPTAVAEPPLPGEPEVVDHDPETGEVVDEAPPTKAEGEPDPDAWAEDPPEDFEMQAKTIREALEACTSVADLNATIETWADRVNAMPRDLKASLVAVKKAMVAKLQEQTNA